VVFVTLIARDLALVDAETLSELTLAKTESNSQGDEALPKAVEVRELSDVATLEPLVALDLFLELEVKRAQWIEGSLEFPRVQARFLQTLAMISETLTFLLDPTAGLLVFVLVANHFILQS
jgi:hypothetical protein